MANVIYITTEPARPNDSMHKEGKNLIHVYSVSLHLCTSQSGDMTITHLQLHGQVSACH